MLLSYDASGQALIVPVLAAAAAYRQSPTADAADSLHGLPDPLHIIEIAEPDKGGLT